MRAQGMCIAVRCTGTPSVEELAFRLAFRLWGSEGYMKHQDSVVLVVDDDSSLREALSSLIRSTGLSVRTYTSAHEFLQAPRPNAPACLVLDVRLPGLSGLELQREL